MGEPLVKRRQLLGKHVLPKLEEPIRYSPIRTGSLKDLIHSVKAQRLEGLIAKPWDSKYKAGRRSGARMKMRVNQGQELVVGGYTFSPKNFAALVVGYYDGARLIYAAHPERVYAGFARRVVQEDQTAGGSGVPVCKPAREKGWSMGRGADGSEDGRVPWVRPMSGSLNS